jgi:hypothetical protein
LVEKKKIIWWTLNILPTMQLIYIAYGFYHVYRIRHHLRPLGLELWKVNRAWPMYLGLGVGFPIAATLVGTVLGAIAAVALRSRWGASTASALAALAVAHFFTLACVGMWP